MALFQSLQSAIGGGAVGEIVSFRRVHCKGAILPFVPMTTALGEGMFPQQIVKVGGPAVVPSLVEPVAVPGLADAAEGRAALELAPALPVQGHGALGAGEGGVGGAEFSAAADAHRALIRGARLELDLRQRVPRLLP